MMKKLLPVILALIGIGGGVGAGLAFKPEPGAMAEVSSVTAPLTTATLRLR